MILTDLKTFEKSIDKKHIFLVSLGALEQHGTYAPLGTDTFIQETLLKKVEEAVPEVVFLPTIPIGASENHIGFWGTISLKEETEYAIISDIVDSISTYSSMIIFVSWHGGNKPVIDKYIEDNKLSMSQIKLVHITFGSEETDISAEKIIGGSLDDHAGNIEVSISLAIKPDVTKQPQIGSKKKAVIFDWKGPVKSVSQEGIIDSNPNWVASKEIGEYLIEVYSNSLVKKIRELIKDTNI